jgi:hypothetical protein
MDKRIIFTYVGYVGASLLPGGLLNNHLYTSPCATQLNVSACREDAPEQAHIEPDDKLVPVTVETYPQTTGATVTTIDGGSLNRNMGPSIATPVGFGRQLRT